MVLAEMSGHDKMMFHQEAEARHGPWAPALVVLLLLAFPYIR